MQLCCITNGGYMTGKVKAMWQEQQEILGEALDIYESKLSQLERFEAYQAEGVTSDIVFNATNDLKEAEAYLAWVYNNVK